MDQPHRWCRTLQESLSDGGAQHVLVFPKNKPLSREKKHGNHSKVISQYKSTLAPRLFKNKNAMPIYFSYTILLLQLKHANKKKSRSYLTTAEVTLASLSAYRKGMTRGGGKSLYKGRPVLQSNIVCFSNT